MPPLCVPGCGVNAHCVYGVPNQCQCNPGFTGNPYSVCGKIFYNLSNLNICLLQKEGWRNLFKLISKFQFIKKFNMARKWQYLKNLYFKR